MACSATCRSRFLWSSSVELLVRKLICRGKMLFHICAGTPAGALTHFCLSPQVKQRQLSIRTKAVNNAPSISAPGRIQAFEDLATQVRMDQQDPGTRIVTAGWHSVADTGMAHIYIWDLRTGEPVLNWQAHEDVINQVVLTTDDSYIVSCSGQFEPGEDVLKVDYSIKVWEASSGIQLLKLPLPSTRLNQGHLLGVKCVAVNSDSTMIISGGYDKAVCLWDMKTGKMLNRIGGLRDVQSTNATIREESKNGHTQPVTAVMFYDLADPEEVQVRRAISISDDLSIRLYDVSAAFGTELRCYGPATAQCEEPYFGGHSLPITSFAIMNNAFHQILATGSEDGSVIIWRLGRNDLTKWQTIKDRFGPKHVVAVSLLPGAALLGRVPRPLLIAASGHRSGYKRQRFTPVADTNVRVLDLETQEVMKTINTKLVHFSGTPINNVAMTPDGKHVVTSNDDGKVGVLSVQDATIVVQLPCPCICPAVLVQDPWQRCQEAPCKDGCNPSPVWPSQVVSTFALFNNPIKVTDPDSRNFQFDTLKFTFEAFCSYGKMYLIESFLRPEQRCTNDRSLCKGNRDCLSDDGNNGLCRFDPRRIDVYSNPDKSTSTVPWPPRQGIHRKPEMELGVGNKILAITGTMKDINQVLASLMYVGDEHFNTRYGLAETVTFNVSDRGALGDTLTDAQNGDGALFGKFEMALMLTRTPSSLSRPTCSGSTTRTPPSPSRCRRQESMAVYASTYATTQRAWRVATASARASVATISVDVQSLPRATRSSLHLVSFWWKCASKRASFQLSLRRGATWCPSSFCATSLLSYIPYPQCTTALSKLPPRQKSPRSSTNAMRRAPTNWAAHTTFQLSSSRRVLKTCRRYSGKNTSPMLATRTHTESTSCMCGLPTRAIPTAGTTLKNHTGRRRKRKSRSA